MPKYPPAAGVKPEDLVKALVRHKPDESEDEDKDQQDDKADLDPHAPSC